MTNFNVFLQFFLAVITITEVVSENHRCYVCIPNIGTSIAEVIQIFPSGPALPLCNGFHKDKKEYMRQCPHANYSGCLTQTNGTHITKTCSLIKVEDCKTANNIKYCYCKTNLCNNESVPAEEARPPVIPNSGSGDDDEDTDPYMEGSGSFEKTTRNRKGTHFTGIGPPKLTPATTVQFKKSSATKFVSASLYLITFLIAVSTKILS